MNSRPIRPDIHARFEAIKVRVYSQPIDGVFEAPPPRRSKMSRAQRAALSFGRQARHAKVPQ